MIGFQHSHYTGILSPGSVLNMSFFFMLHSLSITFQFHCLEKKALIHHHMQFTTLMFGWTLFPLSKCTCPHCCRVYCLWKQSPNDSYQLCYQSAACWQHLSSRKHSLCQRDCPFSLPSRLIWSLCFSFSIYPSC